MSTVPPRPGAGHTPLGGKHDVVEKEALKALARGGRSRAAPDKVGQDSRKLFGGRRARLHRDTGDQGREGAGTRDSHKHNSRPAACGKSITSTQSSLNGPTMQAELPPRRRAPGETLQGVKDHGQSIAAGRHKEGADGRTQDCILSPCARAPITEDRGIPGSNTWLPSRGERADRRHNKQGLEPALLQHEVDPLQAAGIAQTEEGRDRKVHHWPNTEPVGERGRKPGPTTTYLEEVVPAGNRPGHRAGRQLL